MFAPLPTAAFGEPVEKKKMLIAGGHRPKWRSPIINDNVTVVHNLITIRIASRSLACVSPTSFWPCTGQFFAHGYPSFPFSWVCRALVTVCYSVSTASAGNARNALISAEMLKSAQFSGKTNLFISFDSMVAKLVSVHLLKNKGNKGALCDATAEPYLIPREPVDSQLFLHHGLVSCKIMFFMDRYRYS